MHGWTERINAPSRQAQLIHALNIMRGNVQPTAARFHDVYLLARLGGLR